MPPAGMCGSSISVDLRSQRVEQGHKRRCNLNRRDHDDSHHHRQHGDPGPSGPTGQPRPRDKCSGRRPDLERRPMRRDERSADPLLPANRHLHRFPPRADPPPRQAPVSPVPVIQRLDSIIQIRRREQPPQQLLVFRSSAAHMFPDFYRRPTDISNTRRVWHTSSIANTDLIRSRCCRFSPGPQGRRRRRATRRPARPAWGCAGAWSPKAARRAAQPHGCCAPEIAPRGRRCTACSCASPRPSRSHQRRVRRSPSAWTQNRCRPRARASTSRHWLARRRSSCARSPKP